MTTVKMLITGDVGSGKTEFIRTISEIDPVSTEAKVTDDLADLKLETTVAMDFGRITVDDDLVLHLYGTPGQIRFDFMWEILSTGILGYIVMVDSTRPQTCPATRRVIDFFEVISDVPYIVVANKQDVDNAFSADDVRHILSLDEGVPVLPCSALDKEDVKEVLLTLFERILAGVG
ncbi:MAG: ATP/GTP-binding protein [Candidatus Coatesbacteria bacterium]|nr:MAG: ATP/GTP-binding protein [Candidatus Coatesbacteria bacterium]